MNFIKDYALSIETSLGFEETIEKVTALLMDEGFGILTEIDVKDTFKKKIDVDWKPYKILGACNTNYAHQALQAENNIGVFLPCNVVVWDEGDHRVVSAFNPQAIGKHIDNPNVSGMAVKVIEALKSVLNKVNES